MSELLTSYTSGTSSSTIRNPFKYAQTFYHTLGSDYLIDTVQLYLQRASNPGIITAEIQETTAGEPNGSVIDSANYDGDTIDTSYEYITFTFAGTEILSSGVTYAIVLSAPNATFGNTISWAANYSGTYSRGSRWYFNGSSWSDLGGNGDCRFRVYGTLALSAATLDAPADGTTNYYLNSDWLAEFTWTHELSISNHTVWFGPTGFMVEQTDRSRYSIISLKWFNGTTLEYNTEYQWGVRTTVGEDYVDSEIFTLTTIAFAPPLPSGGGDEYGGEGGKNLLRTVRRLLVAAANKIYYEDE